MRALLVLALLLSCTPADKGPDDTDRAPSEDSDGDGVLDVLDCAPHDPSASPAGTEVCDGVDNDCDGETDELAVDAVACYPDLDGDGYGEQGAEAELACACDEGSAEDAADCDDSEFYANPGQVELCGDGLDNDCQDGVDDAGAEDAAIWYPDADGDGFGVADEAQGLPGCQAPEGYVNSASDCDDDDEDSWPEADERCDGLDNDCDGEVDEDASTDTVRWYADADGDGYGDGGAPLSACEDAIPAGHVRDSADCDDSDPDVNPTAAEDCDGVDNDCDGDTDEEGKNTYYLDADGDGYGDPDKVREVCDMFATDVMVLDDTDCDDADDSIYPDAPESCDGEDDNCDGEIDEDSAVDASTWYVDGDADGYGGSEGAVTACEQPDGTVSELEYEAAPDCDDADPNVSPGATERCGGGDEDCDGVVDEAGAADGFVWFIDADGDGYGSKASRVRACGRPLGYAAASTDCDDSDAAVSPAADEVCDVTVDNDCDGDIDEAGAVDGDTYYRDVDRDGYGDDSDTVLACSLPAGFSSAGGDDDDSDPTVH